MSQLLAKMETLAFNQERLARLVNDQQANIEILINNTNHLHNAINNIVQWIGDELGEDAVERLNKRLMPDKEKESGIIVTP